MIHLDTHAVAWLYAGLIDRFDTAVVPLLETEPLRISPMVELELQYLLEIGRIARGPREILSELQVKINLQVCDEPFQHVVAMGLDQTWTRDPFDRLIVAQAALADADLLTKDQNIRERCAAAFWTGDEYTKGRGT